MEEPQVLYFKGKKTLDELFIFQGGRNTKLLSVACKLIKRYGDAVVRPCFDMEAAKCVPLLDTQELDLIWYNATNCYKQHAMTKDYIPPEQFNAPQKYLKKLKPEDNKLYPWTELGAGQIFADFYKNILSYVPERKSGYYYDGVIWQPDVGNIKTGVL